MPLVSVIIPNYNHAPFLRARIESVLDQTYQDFEVIILDDCSPDSSREVIETFRGHPKVSNIVYNDVNSGSTFKQWNLGVKLSRGELIWIAESDDLAAPSLLEGLVGLHNTCPNVGIAYSQSYKIDEKGVVIGDWMQHTGIFNTDLWDNQFCIQGIDVVANYLGFINIIPNASAMLIDKQCYLDAGGADERFILNGDWYLWIKMMMKGFSLAYLPDKRNYFREHSVKVTRSAIRKGLNVSEAYSILQYLNRHISISADVKSKLVTFYRTHYLPGIFKTDVTFKALKNCLLISFRLSFIPTLRTLIGNWKKLIVREQNEKLLV